MKPLLITGGHLIDPAQTLDAPRDLLLREGLVAAVEPPNTFGPQPEAGHFDAAGLLITPGLIDLHVHLREPGQTWKETIATGTSAGAAGGFTSLVAMPNTTPVNDSVETLTWMLAPERNPLTRLFAMPAATLGSQGARLTDFPALAAAGAVGFTDDGKPILQDAIMRQALLAAARLNLVLSQHAEDTRISPSTGIHAGALAFRLGLRGMSVEAEARIVERDLNLLREVERTEHLRPRLHIQHLSTARAAGLIRAAKAEGLAVTAEATPHHFALTEAALGNYDTNAKMNPPLRPEEDRHAILQALLDGTIDAIATDHAPHALHEKEVEFDRAPNGITGLETSLGLTLRILHREHGAPLTHIVALMSRNPAQIANLPQAGHLTPGAWADLTLLDPTHERPFSAESTYSKSRNTPFDGTPLLGRVAATIVAGQIVYRS